MLYYTELTILYYNPGGQRWGSRVRGDSRLDALYAPAHLPAHAVTATIERPSAQKEQGGARGRDSRTCFLCFSRARARRGPHVVHSLPKQHRYSCAGAIII